MIQENSNLGLRRNLDKIFAITGMLCLMFGIITLLALLIDLSMQGIPRLSYEFLTSFPSRFPEKAGILSPWVGSLLVLIVTASVSIPLGIGAAIYLEEYAQKNWITSFIELNITNLAGIPSITFGLMALGLFVYQFNLGQSILTAGMTLGLLVLPIIIITTRESLRAIPGSLREAAFAMGCSKWQMVKDHLIPYSMGGILTGVIIALSRAIGETAPLITVGALTFIAFLPTNPISSEPPYISMNWIMEPFTVLPIQMFNWVSRPQVGFHVNAAATGLILVFLTLFLNGIAIYIRYQYRKKIRW